MTSKEGRMNRNERESIGRLLKATHAHRKEHELTPAWRNSVMAEASRLSHAHTAKTEIERLAPRFTMAAAALSIVALMAATWTFGTLHDTLMSLYTTQALDMTSLPWTSL